MPVRTIEAPAPRYTAVDRAITIREFVARAYGLDDPQDATWGQMDPVVYWMRDNRTKENKSSRTVWVLDKATQKEVHGYLKDRAAVAQAKEEAKKEA